MQDGFKYIKTTLWYGFWVQSECEAKEAGELVIKPVFLLCFARKHKQKVGML